MESSPTKPGLLPPLGATTNRSDLVYESLRAAVLSRRLRPGETLTERAIAEQLGISKTPVREALISLARQGLVMPATRGRIVVRNLSLTDVRHIYEERLLLEPWAISMAVRAGTGTFDAARRSLVDARVYLAQGDRLALAEANRSFHHDMFASCENPFVVNALEALQDLTILAIVGTLWDRSPTWVDEAEEHEAIYAAACGGEVGTVERLARSHIMASIDRLSAHETATG